MGDQWAWPHQAKRGHRAQVSPRRGPAGPGQVRCQGPTVAENQIRFFPDVQITRLPYQRCLEGVPTYQTHWGCPRGSGAWQPHGAWNTKQQILIGTLGFLVNTATQASKRRAGAGLLRRSTAGTNTEAGCPGAVKHPLKGRQVLHPIDRRARGGSRRSDLLKVTCCTSAVPAVLTATASLP